MQTPEFAQEEWLQYIPGAMYMANAEGLLVYFNDAAAELWGRQPTLGVDRWSGAHKAYQANGAVMPVDESPIAIAVREGRQLVGSEIILEKPDGTKRLILTHAKPMFDQTGRVSGAIDLMIDITDVKILEGWSWKQGELKRSEERYHKMIAEVEDYAILLLDRHGVIQNWNIGAEKIKGYKEEEILGRHFRVFYTLGDREARLPEKLIEQAEQNGKAIHEGWRQRKDGTLFWGSIVITALHDDAGGVIGFSKVTRDLSSRRAAEERLRRYSLDLEFQNRELQQFAYAAAHDMKEPLRKLRFYNTSVLESLAGGLPEKEALYLKRANEAATRMQTLIDDLLIYSKASMDGEAFGWVDLKQVLAEAEITYQDVIEETKSVIVASELPIVWGITFQMRQLFENLLGNSLKYRDPKRTAKIQISSDKNRYLSDGTATDEEGRDEYFRITVVDNGIGFDEEKANRIFDIFQRLDNPGKLPGTGIGLAICKRVVQNHKGFILAHATPGKGASFSVYLPVWPNSPDLLAEGQ